MAQDAGAISDAAFGDAAQRTNDQKAALLDAVAQAGTAGLNAYQSAQNQTTALKGQAVQSALAAAATSPLNNIPGGQATALDPINQQYDQRQADLASGAATFGQDMQRQAASGGQFFGQMQAAIPIVQSRTQAALAAILAQQQDAQQQRALQLQQSQLALESARASAAAQGQGNQFAANADARAQADAQRTQYCFDNPGDPKCLGASATLANQKYQDTVTLKAQQNAINAAQDILGGATTQGFAAFTALTRDGMSLADAQAKYKTPGGKPLNWSLIISLANQFNNAGQLGAGNGAATSADNSGGS